MFSNTKYILITTVIAILGLFILIALSLFILNQNNLKFNQMISLVPELSANKTPEELNRDLFNQGKFQELNTELDNQLAVNPGDISLLLQKAQALAQEASLTFKEKELGDQALKYINQVLGLDPKNIEALTLKGYVFEIQQDYVNAHKYYDQALALDPKNAITLAQKAHAYDLEGKFEASLKIYQELMKDKTSLNSEILLKYSRILQMQGKTEEMRKILASSVDGLSNSRLKAETYFMLGQSYQTDDYNPDAEKYFSLSNKQDDSYPMAYVGMSQELFKKSFTFNEKNVKQQLVEKSLGNLETALKINPMQTYASLELARQMIALGNIELAKKTLISTKENIKKDITLNYGDKMFITELTNKLIEAI